MELRASWLSEFLKHSVLIAGAIVVLLPFYLMLSLACGRIALFVWMPFVQARRHSSATSVYFLCALCVYWVCLFGNLSVESIGFSQVGSCMCSPGSDLS